VLDRELVGVRLGSPKAVAVELRVDEDPVSLLARARRELARAAQNETRVSDEGSHELRFTNA
jgi:hypothetical protein